MEEKILKYLQDCIDHEDYEKCTSVEISKELMQSRNQISSICKKLYDENRVVKVATRPHIFLDKQYLENKYHVTLIKTTYESLEELQLDLKQEVPVKDFEKLIGYNDSLNGLVDKVKATISYPTHGLPILFNGPTGTGKSFLARLTYEYCCNQGLIAKDKQFIQVNCSEYANNPELLTANLFGYKKGAFTGADKDNLGLLHYANEGVLFLDEVHCLKAECQEKLFLYMDQGIYHMVGDNEKWYKSRCRIIFATTENPEEVLLKTLLRRIPVILHVPALSQRGTNERLQLIYSLYHREEKRIHKKIKISSNVYQILLSHDFVGNIGELSNVIQSSCVNALFNQKNDTLEIHAYHLPEKIMESIHPSKLIMNKHQMIELNTLKGVAHPNKTIHFYEQLFQIPKDSNFLNQYRKIMDEYFEKIIFNKKELTHNSFLLDTVTQVFDMTTGKYGFKMSHNEIVAMTNYLLEYSHNTYQTANWISDNNHQVDELNDYLKTKYHREYFIGKEIYDYFKDNINDAYDLMVQMTITIMLTKYMNHDNSNQTVAIILAHGYSTASSIAESVNRLLDTYIFDAIDMPLNVSSQTIVEKINDYLFSIGKIKRLYLLVDMGSLEEIYQGIEMKNIDIAMINNVNTKLALMVGNGIQQGVSIHQMFENINEDNPYTVHLELHHQKEPIILCSCASGMGTANKLKNIIKDSLPKEVEMKVLTYDYPTLIEKNMQNDLFEDYDVVCVVGTLNPNIKDLNYLAIEDLIIGNGYDKLEVYFKDYLNHEQLALFEKNVLKNFSLSNVMNNITILNPNKLLEQVSSSLDELQRLMNKQFKNHTCFGLYVHICCLIERLITKQPITSYDSDDFALNHEQFITVLKTAMKDVEEFYNVSIPNEEIEYIYEYIKND